MDLEKRKIKGHAIKESNDLSLELEKNIEEIKRNGFTLLCDVISSDNLKIIRKKIYQIYTLQVDEIGGEKNLNLIHDQGFVMSLLSYDKFFVKFAVDNLCLNIVEYFLGDYYQLFCQNGIINQWDRKDDQIINMWHRDLNYLHFTTSKPFGINVFFCIDDFTSINGGTYFLPGSHKFEKFPGIEYSEKHKKQIEAKAGSAIVFDPMLFHRAGKNKSKNDRITLTNIYTYPFMKQQIDFHDGISNYIGNDDKKRKILGFENRTSSNVSEFRQIRLARKRKSSSNE